MDAFALATAARSTLGTLRHTASSSASAQRANVCSTGSSRGGVGAAPPAGRGWHSSRNTTHLMPQTSV